MGLTVLYDDGCALCRRLKAWLAGQPKVATIRFMAADSPEAHERFPELDHWRSKTLLTVVSDDGWVYEGERAWLACGWALPGWRPVVEHLGSGLRLRAVRLLTRAVDAYRHRGREVPACDTCSITAPKERTHF